MQIKTILNRVQKFKSFVYGDVRWVEGTSTPTLEVEMQPRLNSRAECSGCGQRRPGYDRLPERRFEFIPMWGNKVFFVYAPRRVECPDCGIRVERMPWVSGKHRLTEAYAWFLASPDRALSHHFRGRMVSELRKAYQQGELERISRPGEVDTVLDRLMGIDWVVYTKPWLRNAETVVEYLSRYSHRTAISDARIGAICEGEVEVSYKDYQDNNRWKTLQLPGEELIRRFLLHVLPKGLMRIRHYGFLANRCRKDKLVKIRQWLGQIADHETSDESLQAKNNDWPCPKCHRGQMRVRLALSPIRLTGR